MPFLQIGTGGTAFVYDVQTSGANEQTRSDRRAPTEGTPTYAGGIRRQGAARKREWSFTYAPMSMADYRTLRDKCYNAAYQPCSGDALDETGAVINCVITIDAAPYVEDEYDALHFKRVPQVTLRER